MTQFGYARISSRQQTYDHQVDALVAAGVPPGDVFIDKAFGNLTSRPQLDAMLAKLREGDQVVVTRLQRIARSQQHLQQLVSWFDRHGVDFVVLEQGIDTSTPGGQLVFHVLAALAECDQEMIVESALDDLASARARGTIPNSVRPSTRTHRRRGHN